MSATYSRFSTARRDMRTRGGAWTGRAVTFAGVALALLGIGVLLGWALRTPALTAMHPRGRPSMMPAAALSFALSGVALLFARPGEPRELRHAGAVCAIIVALVGWIGAVEHLVGSIGVHALLVRVAAPIGAGSAVGPTALQTCVAFGIAGGAIAALAMDARHARRWRAVGASLVGAFAYISVLEHLYAVPRAAPLHTGVGFGLLAVGFLLADPESRLAQLLSSSGPGGHFARRLLPLSLGAPALLGYLLTLGQPPSLQLAGFGPATLVAAVAAVFSGATWWSARTLERVDTQRRRAVERADRERAQLDAVVARLPAGIVVAEAPFRRIVRGNARAEEIWRAPIVPSTSVDEYEAYRGFLADGKPLPPDDWALARALRGERVEGQEVHILRGDGTLGWVLNNGEPIRDARGEVTGAIVAFVDITHQKALEAELRALKDELEDRVRARTAELAAANQELEAFSYSVSHDLRAPLRWVHGFSQALVEEYDACLDQNGRAYVREIQSSSARMAQLIDDLLELSRITRVDLHREPVDVSALVHEAVDELQKTNPRENVHVEVQPDLGALGDTRLLRIALMNLLDNAWKFTRTRPAAHIQVGAEEKNGVRAFFVRDDGVGFDMAFAGKLFCPFERLHRANEFEGTGIGLALVRRIVTRHGGRIWAEAAVGRGATFYFTLGSSVHR